MTPPHVRLRALEPGDGPRVLAWRNSPQVADFMYGDHRIATDEHARWLGAALAGGDRRYWITTVDGEPVGVAHVVAMGGEHGRGEWGSYLAEPSMRGRGVGAAVEYLVLSWAFDVRGLRKLWLEVLADNTRAGDLHLAFGFVQEAYLRAHVVKGGRARDALGLGMLAEEWPAAKARAQGRLRDKGWDPDALRIDP